MQLTYNPKDLIETNFPEGIYNFQVMDLVQKQSKTGGMMLSLTLECCQEGGRHTVRVYDYLSYADRALWRLKEFLESIGLTFDPPPHATDIYKKYGKAELHKEKAKSDGREYLRVKHYLSRDEVMQAVADNINNPSDDDDVPF